MVNGSAKYLVSIFRGKLPYLLTCSDNAINCGYTAQAAGDPSVTVEEVTPPVFPSAPLFPVEVFIFSYFLLFLVLFLRIHVSPS
jgi:hypothetical protein